MKFVDTSRPRRAGGPPRRALLLGSVAVAALILWPLIGHTLADDGHRVIDLEVYRAGGQAVLDGRAVYDFRTAHELPFTYPPVAAWLAIPLALVPAIPMGVVWTGLSLSLLAGIMAWTWRPVWTRLGPTLGPLLLPLAIAGMAWVFPFRDNLVLGQVNLVLMALVLLDCALPRTPWPRGALVGLATAIKLTPGLFIPYLWLSGRRRAAYVAAGTFTALAAVTWLVLPEDSARYWLTEMRNPERLGHNWYTTNQSIRGMVLHLHWHGLVGTAVVVALSALALLLVLRRGPELSRRGDEIAAVAVVGLGANLLSPVSWVHHMVWFLLVVAVLIDDWSRPRRVALGFLLVAVLAYKTPYWGAGFARDHAGVLDFFGRIVQSGFTVLAFATVAWLRARVPAAPPRDGEPSALSRPAVRRPDRRDRAPAPLART